MGNYEERKEQEALLAKQQNERDALNGVTPAVKALKAKLKVMADRTNGKQLIGGGFGAYNPREARERQLLDAVRLELMADNKAYFGTLDCRVIRKSYEFKSLNSRQRKAILSQYKWMFEELVQEDLPSAKNDVWHTPLLTEYEALSKKEQANISPMDKLVLYAEELKGEREQPTWLTNSGNDADAEQEVLFAPSITTV